MSLYIPWIPPVMKLNGTTEEEKYLNKKKDNYFALTNGSGVVDPELEFSGDWVIFEKLGNEYKLRAVLQLW